MRAVLKPQRKIPDRKASEPPVESDIEKTSRRTFSKRFVSACALIMFVVAETGLLLKVDDLADIITALGVILIAFAYVYIETGHRDLRVVKGRPSMVESLVQMRFGKRGSDAQA